MMNSLPESGLIRLPEVLQFIPVGKSTWWRGVKSGRYPQPVKLGARITAWRSEDIRALMKHHNPYETAYEIGCEERYETGFHTLPPSPPLPAWLLKPPSVLTSTKQHVRLRSGRREDGNVGERRRRRGENRVVGFLFWMVR